MNTITIGGKEYRLNVTYGKFKKISKFVKKETAENLISMIWLFIQRRWFFLKPFLFKWRLKNKITLKELKIADNKIAELLKVEDRESGN